MSKYSDSNYDSKVISTTTIHDSFSSIIIKLNGTNYRVLSQIFDMQLSNEPRSDTAWCKTEIQVHQ